jgi:Family of unknown function (DUF6427)
MLLRFLKVNDYRSWVYLFVFAILMGVFAISFGVKHVAVFQNSALSLFNIENTNTILIKIVGVLLLLANIFLFDYILTSQELTDSSNHVPAYLLGLYLIYALIESPLNPKLFAQLLLTFSFGRYIATYRVEKAAPSVFDGAFCLSCAVIIYPPYWVFFAIGFICLGVLRAFNFREYSLVFLGLALPYLFYYTVLFLYDQDMQKPMADIANSFHRPAMPEYFKGSFLINFTSTLVIMFTIFFFIKKGTLSGRIKTQKALTVFLWALLPCAAAIFITQNHYVVTARMAVMPLSLFAGIYFGMAKRRILAEILLMLLTGIVVISVLQHAEVISTI